MKKQEKIYQNFLAVANEWEQELNNYTEADLTMQETKEGWTLGQVYIHLINATIGFHLKQVQQCVATDANIEKRKNFKGILAVNILGKFPPIKVKVPPSPTYTPVPPSSKQEIIDGIEKVKLAMKETLPLLATNKGGKTPHPAFQFLDAMEWYKLIDMHWRHHQRQKESILKANQLQTVN